MPFKDILRKKDKLAQQHGKAPEAAQEPTLQSPEFTFMRSDTNTQELISPPSFSSAESSQLPPTADGHHESRTSKLFGRNRSSSAVSTQSNISNSSDKSKSKSPKRLSQRLHFRKSDVVQRVFQVTCLRLMWGKMEMVGPATPTGPKTNVAAFQDMNLGGGPISTKDTDDNIQEAIRLHEEGKLEASTAMFGRLADPNGENNALSQVLYGLALRHGWGCTPNPAEAVKYLSAAASNAALIEDLALKAGMKKGGAAKGELVLAIFELANCFRHGWGVLVDKLAAKQYYETAANLGDTDAMNEVGWCYLEGFGCKKDKWAAAKYYRLAEKNGSKTLGNSCCARPMCMRGGLDGRLVQRVPE
ncbi:hypothetical protein G7Y89_g12611 [Cudoniella acicularis]|uniref:HCP-like protein n=1 Tax=Cudoniella acicularis TaxID=354080 RepID=A0A8H4R9R4_9HELO|nr:hypothetical protein G7Y89_g12611 [Cudoniella acicularis]